MRRVLIYIAVILALMGGLIAAAEKALSYSVRVSDPNVPSSLMKLFTFCGKRHNVEPLFLASVFSAGEHGASWPTTGPWASSPKGAQGPWQFMPTTWPSWAEDGNGDGEADRFNLADSTCAAAAYLASAGARGKYGTSGNVLADLTDAASIYNSGRPASSGRAFAETDTYIDSVLRTYLVLVKSEGGITESQVNSLNPLVDFLADKALKAQKAKKSNPKLNQASTRQTSKASIVLAIVLLVCGLLLMRPRRTSIRSSPQKRRTQPKNPRRTRPQRR